MLIFYVLCFNLYIYELAWGEWNMVLTKAFYYVATLLMQIWLLYSDIKGHETSLAQQFNIISKLTFMVNIILIIVTLCYVLKNPVPYFIVFNGAVFVLTTMILISGSRHGTFKD